MGFENHKIVMTLQLLISLHAFIFDRQTIKNIVLIVKK